MSETPKTQKISKKRNFKIKDILLVFFTLTTIFSFTFGYVLYLQLPKYKLSPSTNSLSYNVLNIIKSDSLYNLPSDDKLAESELKGLVMSLNDPYSEFLDKEDVTKLNDAINQNFQGIGVKLGFVDSKLVIDYVFKGGPADKSGIQAGDEIVKVADKDISGQKLADIINQIRGPENTSVKLGIRRQTKDLDVNITREKIQSELLFLSYKKDAAIIEISSFGQNLDAKMQQAVSQIRQKPEVKKIILDLRGDTGGLLDQAIAVASYLLEANSDVLIEKTKTTSTVLRSSYKSENLVGYKTFVLVDGNTASASEILAGSLRDNRGVELIGEKTFGKGVVQRIYSLPEGRELKLTVSEWLTPKGNSINKTGLEPDIKIKTGEDALQIALEK